MTIMFEDPHTKQQAAFVFNSEDLTSSTDTAIVEEISNGTVRVKPLCVLKIQPGPSTHWIFGDVFFRKRATEHNEK